YLEAAMHHRSTRVTKWVLTLAAAFFAATACIDGHPTTDPTGRHVVGPGGVGRDPAAISEISGVVLDQATATPVAGARVAVGELSTTTATDGSYSLSGIQAFVVLLVTTKDGYEQHNAILPLAVGSNTFRVLLSRPGA
ncbi:MAG: carboxypeptidase regulatory-like domain-containing protein, partial [Gemmatimonadaceae bacterium]